MTKGLVDAAEVITWRRMGCRCTLLHVEVSADWCWRVVFHLQRGSVPMPDDYGSFVPVQPGAKHLRHKANRYAVVWVLPFDVDVWPPLGPTPDEIPGQWEGAERIDYRRMPPGAGWGMALGALPPCEHGAVVRAVGGKNLRDALADDARKVIATGGRVARELPPASA